MWTHKVVKSWMEHKVWKVLENNKRICGEFRYEPCTFYLTSHGLKYTPDFLLRDLKINGKQVILEPHGHRLGGYRKYKLFRDTFGESYYLILITRNDDIPNIPKESYDEIWPIEYLHLLPKQLQKLAK